MERMDTKLTRVREETIDNQLVSVFSSKNRDQEEPENWVTIMRRYAGARVQGDRKEAEAEVLGRTQLFIRHGSCTPGGCKASGKYQDDPDQLLCKSGVIKPETEEMLGEMGLVGSLKDLNCQRRVQSA